MATNDYTAARLIHDVTVRYQEHWRKQPDRFWMRKLNDETSELRRSLKQRHGDTPDLELIQIASTCLNWLDKRNVDVSALEKELLQKGHILTTQRED